jgi:hypothetical protein
VRCHIHVGPESSVTNSKKVKKCETVTWRHFISARCGKKSNLDKINLTESSFTKMTYHVRGCMAFRLNELGLGLIMAEFVKTRPYRTHAWPLGCEECHRVRFSFRPMKSVFSIFKVPKSGFL